MTTAWERCSSLRGTLPTTAPSGSSVRSMNEVALSCLHSKRQSEFAATEQGNEFLLDQEISAPCGWLQLAPHLVRPTQKSLFQ
jgi:hypothetical protein